MPYIIISYPKELPAAQMAKDFVKAIPAKQISFVNTYAGQELILNKKSRVPDCQWAAYIALRDFSTTTQQRVLDSSRYNLLMIECDDGGNCLKAYEVPKIGDHFFDLNLKGLANNSEKKLFGMSLSILNKTCVH